LLIYNIIMAQTPAQRQAKYRLNNPEKCIAAKKKSWYKNHDKNITLSREKYQKNKLSYQENNLKTYHSNRLRQSNTRLKRLFGMTLIEYNLLSEYQNNLCAICNNPETILDNKQLGVRKLAVDHCHITNTNRGLLCFNCNIGLGKFKDSIQELEKAILYLKKHTS
jgi:hypothetical protein